jgi:hypothetical protein
MFSIEVSNYCPCGAVNVLLNPKDEQVSSASAANVLLNSNVDEVLAATFTAPCSAAKEDDESPATAIPLSQASVTEVDENPPAAIPLSQSVVKKEDKKSIAAIPLSHSAVKDEKPVVSAPRPQLSVKVNIPKHEESQKAHAGERPPKKLKLSQEAVQDMVPSMTDKRPLALPSSQAVNSLNRLFLYTACYSCYCFLSCFWSTNMLPFYLTLQSYKNVKRHYCIFLNCSIPSFVHTYIFPDPCSEVNERWNEEKNVMQL